MPIQLKQYVELRGDNPLEAVIAGEHYKAYLVANLAFNDSPTESAQHYGISLAEVHGAMAFYYENESAIETAIQNARESGSKQGAKTLTERLKNLGGLQEN